MARPKSAQIAEVVWEDTTSTHGWQDDLDGATTIYVRSVGYISRTAKYVKLVQSHSYEGPHSEVLTIPKANVRRLHILGTSRAKRIR